MIKSNLTLEALSAVWQALSPRQAHEAIMFGTCREAEQAQRRLDRKMTRCFGPGQCPRGLRFHRLTILHRPPEHPSRFNDWLRTVQELHHCLLPDALIID